MFRTQWELRNSLNYAILSKKFNDVGRLVSMTQHPSHSFCGRLVSITTHHKSCHDWLTIEVWLNGLIDLTYDVYSWDYIINREEGSWFRLELASLHITLKTSIYLLIFHKARYLLRHGFKLKADLLQTSWVWKLINHGLSWYLGII